MSRLTAPFLGVALLAGAFWVATQSYQNHFSGPALSPAEQQRLGVQLLAFPRAVPLIQRLKEGQWQAIQLQPPVCDAVCQGKMAQNAALGVHIIPPNQTSYSELVTVVSAEKYAVHQTRVLLINPAGKFAGSISPPYTKTGLNSVFKSLEP